MNPSVLSFVRILVVDDQRAMRAILRDLLHRIGIRDIVEADSGSAALDALVRELRDKKPVDMILSDLHMANMDGMELVAHIRRGHTADIDRAIPILILTGDSDALMLDVAQQAGATELLRKPVSAPDLMRAIARVVGVAVSDKDFARAVSPAARAAR